MPGKVFLDKHYSSWKERTDKGGIRFGWHQEYIPVPRRPTVWDLLQHPLICPRCTYVWEPRNGRMPVSCPMCKTYFAPKREPIPAGWEYVSSEEWDKLYFLVYNLYRND